MKIFEFRSSLTFLDQLPPSVIKDVKILVPVQILRTPTARGTMPTMSLRCQSQSLSDPPFALKAASLLPHDWMPASIPVMIILRPNHQRDLILAAPLPSKILQAFTANQHRSPPMAARLLFLKMSEPFDHSSVLRTVLTQTARTFLVIHQMIRLSTVPAQIAHMVHVQSALPHPMVAEPAERPATPL